MFLTSVAQDEYLSVLSLVNPIQVVLYVTEEKNLIILTWLVVSFADILSKATLTETWQENLLGMIISSVFIWWRTKRWTFPSDSVLYAALASGEHGEVSLHWRAPCMGSFPRCSALLGMVLLLPGSRGAGSVLQCSWRGIDGWSCSHCYCCSVLLLILPLNCSNSVILQFLV